MQLEQGIFGGKPKYTTFEEVVGRASSWIKSSHVSIILLLPQPIYSMCYGLLNTSGDVRMVSVAGISELWVQKNLSNSIVCVTAF